MADFGCGVGVVTRMLAQMVGASGSVSGIDVNGNQLEERVNYAPLQVCQTRLSWKLARARRVCPVNPSILFTVVSCCFTCRIRSPA